MKEVIVYQLPTLVEIEGLVILIDILRATSTIVAALGEEARVVKPVASLEEARLFREKGFLLAGERGGFPPDDFDFGNSPKEAYHLSGQKVVLSTTNGTKALEFVQHAQAICAGSFLNLSAIAEFARRFEKVVLLCAGTEGELSLEDFLFAGKVAERLADYETANDAATVARRYAAKVTDLLEEIRLSKHAIRLEELGFEEDVLFCAQVDRYPVIPILTPEGFVALKGVSLEGTPQTPDPHKW